MQTATETYPETRTMIAVYRFRTAAEQAIRSLFEAGISPSELSVVGQVRGTANGANGWNGTGWEAMCSGDIFDKEVSLWEPLPGRVVFPVPGIGRIAAAGPLALALQAGLDSDCSFGGLTVLGVVLYAAGIPRDIAHRYEVSLMTGSYLILVRASRAEAVVAEWRLNGTDADEIRGYGMEAGAIQ